MVVEKLIQKLMKLPPKSRVKILYDGELRANVDKVYLAENGCVVLTDNIEICYSESGKPKKIKK